MTVRGTVAYQVTEDSTELFGPPGSTRTLYNSGPSKVWVSTTANVRPNQGIPLSKQASIPWDADKACHACTDGTGQQATILTVDNAGQINDPAALAALIAGGQADAQAIADAIAASGLTSSGIATAIRNSGLDPENIAVAILATLNPIAIGDEVGLSVPTAAAIGAAVGLAVPSAASIGAAAAAPAGTPVVLQLIGLGTSAGGSSPAFGDVWVNGVKDNGGWDVPAGKRLVVQTVTVEAVNGGAVAMAPRIQLVEDGAARVFHAIAMRIAATTSRGLVQTIPPGAIVVPAGVDLRVKDVTGAAGITLDVTVNGTLY